MVERCDFRVSWREDVREGDEGVTSRWRVWEMDRWWVGVEEKGLMTWKLSEEMAAERKEWRRLAEVEGKEGPTSLMVMGTESLRERREAMVRGEGVVERDFLRWEERER